MAKFSITVPAFKLKYLKECIDSILNQTVTDFELIIVNDASPEDLDSIVNQYSDLRIRYYKNNSNIGAVNVVDNWNTCLKYASGDYIICMGDDDKLLPNCLEEYDKLIKKYPKIDVFHAWTEIIDEDSEIIRMQESRPEFESVYSMIWNRWNNRVQYIGDFLFRASKLRNIGGFYKTPLAWAADDITVIIASKENGIVNSQIPMFQYRMNSLTISSSKNIPYKMDAINVEEDFYKDFFAKDYSANDKVSSVFRKMAIQMFPKEMFRKRATYLSQDLQDHLIRKIFFYVQNMKKWRLKFSIIGYAFILYLIKRLK